MDGDDIRKMLQQKVFDAVNELLNVTGAEACALPIPGRQPPSYVAVGPAESIVDLLIPGDENDTEGQR